MPLPGTTFFGHTTTNLGASLRLKGAKLLGLGFSSLGKDEAQRQGYLGSHSAGCAEP